MTLTQREYLEHDATFRPDETAIRSIDGDRTWTFAEFDAAVDEVATAFRARGLRPGDRVALVLRNTVEFPVATYACHKVGLVAIPINYRLSAGELRTIFDDAHVSTVVYDEAFSAAVETAAGETLQPTALVRVGSAGEASGDDATDTAGREDPSIESFDDLRAAGTGEAPPPIERAPNDPSYIIYTSGTTGRPKGVVHTVTSARERTLAAIVSFEVTADSVVLSQLPYFHGGGLDAALRAAVTAGAELVVAADYADPETSLAAIDAHGVTHVVGVPTVSKRMVEHEALDEYDLSTIECWYHTGEVLPEDRARQFRERLSPNVVNSYGSSEGGFITVLSSEDVTAKAGSVGRPTLGTQIRVVELDASGRVEPSRTVPRGERGEVLVRSDQLFREYFQNLAATREAVFDGWYYTNDLGILDDDGYLTITGRVDDVIVSGGELISPAEVEAALESHDAVHEAVAVGEPDDEWGERVVAYVSLVADATGDEGTPTDADATAAELDAFCRNEGTLADYKRPRRYEFVPEIVHTESGKKERSEYRGR